eukprot:GHVT01018251.1.p1 GENE.GHVT01018251.1~~GHVT01018251.1.p1  ORF type:complete len:179 (+),score=24.48 GHVT01018251.1:49-537(+)
MNNPKTDKNASPVGCPSRKENVNPSVENSAAKQPTAECIPTPPSLCATDFNKCSSLSSVKVESLVGLNGVVNLVAPVSSQQETPHLAATAESDKLSKVLSATPLNGFTVTRGFLPTKPNYDPNYARGKFNVEDAVSFLHREWENVLHLRETNPENVITYQAS